MSKEKTKLDIAAKEVEEIMLAEAAKANKMKPILDRQLKVIQQIDNKINWFENKIKEMEAEKQKELDKMQDLLDLAMVSSHSLKNGFTVMPDDKREFEVNDSAAFLKWLKINAKPVEVMEFFSTALKKTSIRSFCNKQANLQTEKGIQEPKIDGINFGAVTYMRLTTLTKKVKK